MRPSPGRPTPDAQLLVIHALGVHPAFARRGIAQRMVQYAIGTARPQGCRALRLDVLGGNVPAERLYTGQGFARRGTVRMFYADTGWTDYGLYGIPAVSGQKKPAAESRSRFSHVVALSTR